MGAVRLAGVASEEWTAPSFSKAEDFADPVLDNDLSLAEFRVAMPHNGAGVSTGGVPDVHGKFRPRDLV